MGTGVQPLQGENYTYSHVLGHVQPLIRLHFHRVVLLDFYLPLVHFLAWIAAEVRERELSNRLGGFLLSFMEINDQESGMPELPASRCLDDILACCLHRKPQPIPWLHLYLCIHLKLAYGW